MKVDSEEECKVSDLLKKMQAAYDRVAKEAVAGVYGKRVVPSKDDKDDDNPDTRPDFPYVDDPEGFVTHVPMEASADNIREAPEPAQQAPPEQQAAATEDPGAEQMPADTGGEEGGIGDMGMDAQGNMPGMMQPGMENMEPLTSSQIGRVYELKKIYTRLSSVETMLSRTTDTQMLEVRKLVGRSIDLFEVVISNFPQFKDKVDEIIVTYYEFLDSVYGSLKKYFSEMSKEQ